MQIDRACGRAARATACFFFGALTMTGGPSPVPATAAHTPTRGEWGDQGNGTYANPVVPGDFSDLDVTRVREDYYAISSTLQYSPGMVVLHSKDLVNWEIIGHVVDDLSRLDPELNWDKMNRPGRGIWAGSIRYHSGKFWVYFGTPDQGFFVSTAANPAGPWSPAVTVWRAGGWDDPCPFWEDDGKGYLVATHFAPEGPSGTTYNIHLFDMTADGKGLVNKSDRIIHQSRGSEANKLYKINGLHYHYYSEVRPEGRVVMMGRAKTLAGAWETRQLLHVDPAVDKQPNQGGLVELANGKWYFLSHQGTGDWEGRAAVLLPVSWIKGWPNFGTVGKDGIGNMLWRAEKPIQGFRMTTVATSDDFNGSALKPNWEWNYQPHAGSWSLTQRPGFLRLYALPPLRAGFGGLRDVLTQRSMRTRRSSVVVKLDLAALAPELQVVPADNLTGRRVDYPLRLRFDGLRVSSKPQALIILQLHVGEHNRTVGRLENTGEANGCRGDVVIREASLVMPIRAQPRCPHHTRGDCPGVLKDGVVVIIQFVALSDSAQKISRRLPLQVPLAEAAAPAILLVQGIVHFEVVLMGGIAERVVLGVVVITGQGVAGARWIRVQGSYFGAHGIEFRRGDLVPGKWRTHHISAARRVHSRLSGIRIEDLLQGAVCVEGLGEITRPLKRRWHGSQQSVGGVVDGPIVIEEVEKLVFYDRAAHCSAELMAMVLRDRLTVWLAKKLFAFRADHCPK